MPLLAIDLGKGTSSDSEEPFPNKCKGVAVDSRTLALISFVNTYLCRELKIEQVGK